MSTTEVESGNEKLEALHRRLAENALAGHWQDREQAPKLEPWVWRW
jgi:hypothetical protein